jgi:Protein of unknown function (DUF2806)
MNDSNSIINLGDISKPAVVLIEKISDAIGGLYKPTQIRRIASAEAAAEKIKAVAAIEINELEQRAVQRFVLEEAKKQGNIESITKKALPYLTEDANPANIEDDWIVNVFDKCRLISDEQMQLLWARILAGEANSPGRYSKNTIRVLDSFDKSDAILFSTLCRFSWSIYDEDTIVLIYDTQSSIYTDFGIDFMALEHLDDIGLISFNSASGYELLQLPKQTCTSYNQTKIHIDFPLEQNNNLMVGKIMLTRTGKELASICVSEYIPDLLEYIPDLLEYILGFWRDQGFIVSSPYPCTLPMYKELG